MALKKAVYRCVGCRSEVPVTQVERIVYGKTKISELRTIEKPAYVIPAKVHCACGMKMVRDPSLNGVNFG